MVTIGASYPPSPLDATTVFYAVKYDLGLACDTLEVE
jgi:hypothetical protein